MIGVVGPDHALFARRLQPKRQVKVVIHGELTPAPMNVILRPFENQNTLDAGEAPRGEFMRLLFAVQPAGAAAVATRASKQRFSLKMRASESSVCRTRFHGSLRIIPRSCAVRFEHWIPSSIRLRRTYWWCGNGDGLTSTLILCISIRCMIS